MIDLKIARNYASCLFDNVISDAERQKVLEQISLFNEVVLNSNNLKSALYSPVFSKSDKIELIENLVKKLQLAQIVKQFFIVVIKNSRFEILQSVVNEYNKLLNESRGIKIVTLEFVTNPNQKLVNMMRKYLAHKLNKTIEFNLINNQELIGGVIIKYDSLLYDYSIAGAVERATKLAKLAKL